MPTVFLAPVTLLVFAWTVFLDVSRAEPIVPATGRSIDSSGIVSGLMGQAAAVATSSGASRELRIGDRVTHGEEIRVGPTGSVELLWERRALLTLEERTRIVVQESVNGSALVQLLDGTIRIAFSYNEGHPTDTLKIQTPGSRMTLRGGIIEVALGTGGAADERRRADFRETRGELLRVLEGQAQVEPRSPAVKPFLLKAGYEVWLTSNSETGDHAIRPSAGQAARRLVTVQNHHHVPDATVQRMVRVHVEHALEVERALAKPPRESPDAEGTVAKGAIVATSLGIPLGILSSSAGAIAASNPLPTVVAGPTPGGAGPGAVPSIPTAPPMPPPPPVVQIPSLTGLAPSQSGGINSQSLLRDILQDVTRGPSRGRGRDRD